MEKNISYYEKKIEDREVEIGNNKSTIEALQECIRSDEYGIKRCQEEIEKLKEKTTFDNMIQKQLDKWDKEKMDILEDLLKPISRKIQLAIERLRRLKLYDGVLEEKDIDEIIKILKGE